MRASSLACLACGALALTAIGCERNPIPGGTVQRQNVILISLDTVRADRMPFQGYGRATMPNLSTLAAESSVFLNAYANSNTTLPSHVTMFTGVLPSTHRIMHPIYDGRRDDAKTSELAAEFATLPELMRREGMRTVRFASSRDFFLDASIGLGRGFDEFHPYGMESDWTTEQITRWFDEWDGKTRFFAFIHSKRPHAPYTLPPAYRNLFGPKYRGPVVDDPERLRETMESERFNAVFQGTLPGIWPESDLFAMLARPTHSEDTRRLSDLYDGALKLTDDLLGKVIASLRKRGLLRHTLLIVTADHGEEFREHGRLLHDSLHREVLRVPMMFRLPGRERLAPTSQPVQLADLVPTILELLGRTVPTNMEGQSFASYLLGRVPQPARHDEIFAFKRAWRQIGAASILTPEWKYIESSDGRRELYDVAKDPAEKSNVVAQQPTVATSLHERLARRAKSLQ